MLNREEFLIVAGITISVCWLYIYFKHMRNDNKER